MAAEGIARRSRACADWSGTRGMGKEGTMGSG